jgi:hypothetical protein
MALPRKATLMLFFAKVAKFAFTVQPFPRGKKGFCIDAGVRSVQAQRE